MTKEEIITLCYRPIQNKKYILGVVKEYPFFVARGNNMDDLKKECFFYINNYLKLIKEDKLPKHDLTEQIKRSEENRSKDKEGWTIEKISFSSHNI